MHRGELLHQEGGAELECVTQRGSPTLEVSRIWPAEVWFSGSPVDESLLRSRSADRQTPCGPFHTALA